ncbi:LacI family DNA-binding transcriptional regulator [Bordetella avium]|nr:LacI family transcriptional regulator [Bordetella avium]AZY51432.1 LacI family transcriptional regulator [Bordetella avium]RIQ14709.1 LacI family DNA-binding transcriptional regulator [Bordetella avium]RIQ41056.1 LacI family DNA-binding transcriptional regulator [Bordetella avium]RIQ46153.1 LacI family DNA-binding transcriptional regulator [Bordetella avium]
MASNPMKPSIRRPTLADVAKLAGVSLGSASRALSVPNEVKPATLERVNRAVAQLGYIRDGAAAALASRRTRTVGAVYPTLNNPIYAHSTHSMQQTLWEMGYQLLIASHEYHIDDEAAVLRATVERGVDGIIMVGTDHSEEVFALLHQRSLPYVLTWSVDDSNYPHCVGISNYTAAYDLARCVLAHGHTRVGICGGPIERNERARGRRNGVLGALREQGLSVPAEWINEQPFSFEGGRQAIREYWSRPERPSVIFFGTDLLAMGALHECRRLGIAVPEQLSIVGFDGIDEGEMMQPELTTVSIPAQEIGRRAARHIVDLIEDREPAPSGPLPHTVLERGSLGAPATAPRRAAKTETRA